jgi:hypothetical protein
LKGREPAISAGDCEVATIARCDDRQNFPWSTTEAEAKKIFGRENKSATPAIF